MSIIPVELELWLDGIISESQQSSGSGDPPSSSRLEFFFWDSGICGIPSSHPNFYFFKSSPHKSQILRLFLDWDCGFGIDSRLLVGLKLKLVEGMEPAVQVNSIDATWLSSNAILPLQQCPSRGQVAEASNHLLMPCVISSFWYTESDQV